MWNIKKYLFLPSLFFLSSLDAMMYRMHCPLVSAIDTSVLQYRAMRWARSSRARQMHITAGHFENGVLLPQVRATYDILLPQVRETLNVIKRFRERLPSMKNLSKKTKVGLGLSTLIGFWWAYTLPTENISDLLNISSLDMKKNTLEEEDIKKILQSSRLVVLLHKYFSQINFRGMPLVHLAVEALDQKVLRALLQDESCASKLNYFLPFIDTPLNLAIKYCNPYIIHTFLIEAVDNNLGMVSDLKKTELKVSHDYSIKVEVVNKFKEAHNIFKILLEDSRIDINKGNILQRTALHTSVAQLNRQSLKMLLKHHDIEENKQDINGHTAVHLAVFACARDQKLFHRLLYPKMYDHILSYLRSTVFFSSILKRFPELTTIIPQFYLLTIEKIDQIIESLTGGHSTVTDPEGCISGSPLIILETLLGNTYVDATIKDKKGLTPLHYAVISRNKEIVELITKNLRKYNNPKVFLIEDNNGLTVFDWAAALYSHDTDIINTIYKACEEVVLNNLTNNQKEKFLEQTTKNQLLKNEDWKILIQDYRNR